MNRALMLLHTCRGASCAAWLLAGLLLLPSCGRAAPPPPDAPELLQKFMALQEDYDRKLAAGYTVETVLDQMVAMKTARQAGDWDKIRTLLKQAEAGLAAARPHTGVADPGPLARRFTLLRDEFMQLHAARKTTPALIALGQQVVAEQRKEDWSRLGGLMDRLEAELRKVSPAPVASTIPDMPVPVPGGQDPGPPTGGSIAGFQWGIEWARLNKAKLYQELGCSTVRIGPVPWGLGEPRPPVGGRHTYQWAQLDRVVTEWQAAGFTSMQFVTSAKNDWAMQRVNKKVSPEAAAPPQDQYWDDYGDFIQALMERYDNDGRDDMPGLRVGLHYVQIEGEPQHEGFWLGTVEDYGRLLREAYRGAKAANPKSQVMVALVMGDLTDDDPTIEQLEQRIQQLGGEHRRSRAFVGAMLRMTDHFDLVDIHYNYDYKSLYTQARWVRALMGPGGAQKGIWAGDAGTAPMFDGFLKLRFTRAEADRTFNALKNASDPAHDATVASYEREQAATLVKKGVLALECGLKGIHFGNLEDWESSYWGGRNWTWHGLLRNDGSKRPAFGAYEQLIDRFRPLQRIEKLPAEKNVFAYRLTGPGRELYVMWCDRGTATYTLKTAAPQLSLASAVPGEEPPAASLTPTGGSATIRLSAVPLYVQPGN